MKKEYLATNGILSRSLTNQLNSKYTPIKAVVIAIEPYAIPSMTDKDK